MDGKVLMGRPIVVPSRSQDKKAGGCVGNALPPPTRWKATQPPAMDRVFLVDATERSAAVEGFPLPSTRRKGTHNRRPSPSLSAAGRGVDGLHEQREKPIE